jgi:hypothetical protein
MVLAIVRHPALPDGVAHVGLTRRDTEQGRRALTALAVSEAFGGDPPKGAVDDAHVCIVHRNRDRW